MEPFEAFGVLAVLSTGDHHEQFAVLRSRILGYRASRRRSGVWRGSRRSDGRSTAVVLGLHCTVCRLAGRRCTSAGVGKF
jgi:hypothetical protein